MVLLRKWVWFEPFWVLFVGAFLLLPPRFLPPTAWDLLQAVRPWLIGALALFWPLRWLAYGRLTLASPLNIPLAVLIAWLPVAFWASADKTVSWEAIGYLAFGLMLFFACINWPPFLVAPERLAWLLALIGAGMLLAAPVLSRLIVPSLPGLGPIDAVLQSLAKQVPGDVNLNRTAAALSLFLPFYVGLAGGRVRQLDGEQGAGGGWCVAGGGRQKARRWLPALFLLLALASGVALLLTQSRGAMLAAAGGVVVVVLLRWPRLRVAAPLLALLLLPAIASLDGGASDTAVAGAAAALPSAGDAVLLGWDGRLELWSRALYILNDFPFTGSGIGAFDRVVHVLYPLFLSNPDAPISHAHSLLLQVGVDLGIPGLIAYLALFINTFLLLARVMRQPQAAMGADLAWALAAGIAGSLTAMLLHGLVDAALWGSKPAFLPWLFVALAVVLSLRPAAPGERHSV